MKCKVPACTNKNHNGKFMYKVCSPCGKYAKSYQSWERSFTSTVGLNMDVVDYIRNNIDLVVSFTEEEE